MTRPRDQPLERLLGEGLCVVPDVLDKHAVDVLRCELENARDEDARRRPNAFDAGMVHNCMFRGEAMRSLLDNAAMSDVVGKVLGDTFILYAYQSSSLDPGSGNYGSRVHVDSPRFIPEYATNVGVIFALDGFTEANGATRYMPRSHLSRVSPTTESFEAGSMSATCNAGDMIVFQGRLFHKAGVNRTDRARHALTLNFCRSYMRQRFDYPRMVTEDEAARYSENTRRVLGWHVRMPTSLDEFYVPEEQRLYRANQG